MNISWKKQLMKTLLELVKKLNDDPNVHEYFVNPAFKF